MSESIIDCSTLSISYAVNGLAQISFTMYMPDGGSPYNTGSAGFSMNIGGRRFEGYIVEQAMVPASQTEFSEWRVTAMAIGC